MQIGDRLLPELDRAPTIRERRRSLELPIARRARWRIGFRRQTGRPGRPHDEQR